MARITESLTALLIAMNIRYKAHAGIRLTGLPATLEATLLRWPATRRRRALRRHRRGEARPGPLRPARRRAPAVIANTGDDIEIYGAHVSPDPDLVTFWLADRIDERGWGIDGDTFTAMEMLRELGVEVWFQLGDRDLALCLERAPTARRGSRADSGARAR